MPAPIIRNFSLPILDRMSVNMPLNSPIIPRFANPVTDTLSENIYLRDGQLIRRFAPPWTDALMNNDFSPTYVAVIDE